MTCQSETSKSEIVYQNEKSGTVITKEYRKSKSMRCMNCAWSTVRARKHPNVTYTMKRLYIKHKNKWKVIGWHCPHCGSIILDKLVKPLIGYFKPPDPTIKVLKTEYY